VKQSVKESNLQLNLLLRDAPAVPLLNDQQRELILALAEMLLSAARESASQPAIGGNDESETD
jgi:hypothetical protein